MSKPRYIKPIILRVLLILILIISMIFVVIPKIINKDLKINLYAPKFNEKYLSETR